MNPKVNDYVAELKHWVEATETLRDILGATALIEAYKWKQPCYTYNNKNVALLFAFKDYCGLSFLKGALMKDPHGLLERPGPNTNSGRIMKFTSVESIHEHTGAIRDFVAQAIQIEAQGLTLPGSEKIQIEVPTELSEAFAASETFADAFHALTPGRQKGYLLYFNAAKASTTRTKRIEKYWDRILNNKGFHDCVCGLSNRMPTCDGSHKKLKEK